MYVQVNRKGSVSGPCVQVHVNRLFTAKRMSCSLLRRLFGTPWQGSSVFCDMLSRELACIENEKHVDALGIDIID